MIKKNVDEITNDIADLPCFSQRIKISEIKKGYSHQCYKVTEQGTDYFVKFLGGQNVGEQSISEQSITEKNTIPRGWGVDSEGDKGFSIKFHLSKPSRDEVEALVKHWADVNYD